MIYGLNGTLGLGCSHPCLSATARASCATGPEIRRLHLLTDALIGTSKLHAPHSTRCHVAFIYTAYPTILQRYDWSTAYHTWSNRVKRMYNVDCLTGRGWCVNEPLLQLPSLVAIRPKEKMTYAIDEPEPAICIKKVKQNGGFIYLALEMIVTELC